MRGIVVLGMNRLAIGTEFARCAMFAIATATPTPAAAPLAVTAAIFAALGRCGAGCCCAARGSAASSSSSILDDVDVVLRSSSMTIGAVRASTKSAAFRPRRRA